MWPRKLDYVTGENLHPDHLSEHCEQLWVIVVPSTLYSFLEFSSFSSYKEIHYII